MSERLLACVARATRGWVRLYTAGLAPEIREARRAELASDLWEQEHAARAAGVRPARTGAHVLRRLLLGIPADLSWRRDQGTAGLLRLAGRAAVDGARSTTSAFVRHWGAAAGALALTGVFLTFGLVGRAEGGVDQRPKPPCTFVVHDADKARAR